MESFVQTIKNSIIESFFQFHCPIIKCILFFMSHFEQWTSSQCHLARSLIAVIKLMLILVSIRHTQIVCSLYSSYLVSQCITHYSILRMRETYLIGLLVLIFTKCFVFRASNPEYSPSDCQNLCSFLISHQFPFPAGDSRFP